jgi:hypothetical protein
MTATPEVKPGQVWADNDARNEGRTLRVVGIEPDKRGHPCNPPRSVAVCEIITHSADVQARVDGDTSRNGWTWKPKDRRGKTVRIRLDRFRPTTTGYRLISEAPEQTTGEVPA